jgi:hypothetical protein
MTQHGEARLKLLETLEKINRGAPFLRRLSINGSFVYLSEEEFLECIKILKTNLK